MQVVQVCGQNVVFEIIRSHVAGIDMSDNGGMMVSYPINPTEIVVEEFACYTRDLRRLSATLQSHGIESVAMESTGVYRIPLFLLLQEEGFEVYLVNAKHAKNVTGRKDDEGDTSRLGLAPNTKISGGKIISSHVPKKKHHAGQVLRMAAMSLRNNKGPLGDYYRRIRSVAGGQKAIVAHARKLAIIYFQMITTKQKYDPLALTYSMNYDNIFLT
ncbi:MAG: transposase [Dysgonamonadaceae bacterium]|nr:transposase [Dysgonamonadaceae bacterium]